jgi:hypothetical protein
MRTGGYGRQRIPTTVLAVALCYGASAAHAEDASWWSRSAATAGVALHSLDEHAASVWASAAELFSSSPSSAVAPSLIADDDRPFFAVLEAAGLQLGEVRIAGTVLRSTEYRLVASRKPSPTDLERAEHAFEIFRTQQSGLRAGAKERIVRTALDLVADRNFVLTAVTIELTPWPSAKYEVHAREHAPATEAPPS